MNNTKTILALWLLSFALLPYGIRGQIDLSDTVDVDNVMPENAETGNVEAPLPEDVEIVINSPDEEKQAAAEIDEGEETITVDFPDEEIRKILRNVADLLDLNLVIPEALQGRTSIQLRNITWRQLFKVILEPIKYTYVEDGNVIRVQNFEDAIREPTETRVFILNYATAETIKSSVMPMIETSAGGQIEINVRSNALIVSERPSRLNKIQKIIDRLDTSTEQIMIESKFIEVSGADIENIGLDWTSLGSYQISAGAALEDTLNSGGTRIRAEFGGQGLDSLLEGDSEQSSAFMNTAVFTGPQFNVILQALKTNNDTKLVSNPTIVTLNNTEAKIVIGERYPIPQYSFNSESGTRSLDGVSYEDIGIKLDVTPQVNSAGFINMKIVPEVSSTEGSQTIEGTQIPVIQSRRTETNIMVKDGYTLAIGGLSQNTVIEKGSKVPLLGDLPGIGRLFKSTRNEDRRRNLIIFITAKILSPDGSTYRDVFDPRVLDKMEIIPSDLPGYRLPEKQHEALRQLEEYRMNQYQTNRENRLDSRIKAYRILEKRSGSAE